MVKVFLLIILNHFSSIFHLGNTENGLGMLIGASGEMTQIGIFEKGETNSWSIFAYRDEEFYLEKIGNDIIENSIKIEYISKDKYEFELIKNGKIKKGFLSKSEKLKFIRKERRKLFSSLKNKYSKITFKNNSIIEKTEFGEIRIKFKRNGAVIFTEIRKDEKVKIYKQQMI